MATSKRKAFPPFPLRDALLVDNEPCRRFRDDPFARLLILASVEERREAIGDPNQTFPALPFWASVERHAQFSASTHCCNHWRSYEHGLSDRDKAREITFFTDHSAARQGSMREVASLAGPAALAEVERACATGLYSEAAFAIFACFEDALEAMHAQPISQAQLDDCLARGRSHLVERHGFSQERLDQLQADPQCCVALSRMLYLGATDPALIVGALFSHETVANGHNAPARFLGSKCWTFALSHLERRRGAQKQASIAPPPRNRKSLLDLFSNLYLPELQDQIKKNASASRATFFALQADDEGFKAFREALVAGACASENPLTDEPWAPVSPLGDFDLDVKMEPFYEDPACKTQLALPRKRDPYALSIPGKAARFGSFQSALLDADTILQWRNPLATMAAVNANHGVGAQAIEIAAADAKRFNAHAANVCAHGLRVCALAPSARKGVASVLATAVAQGFAGLEDSQSVQALFFHLTPESEGKPVPASAQRQRWFASELASDPMGPLAMAVGQACGLDAPLPSGLVGEAKKALAERHLSNAAWKALAAQPALRDMLMQAAAESLQARDGLQPAKPRAALAEAAHVMSRADQEGSSVKARVQQACDQDAKRLPLDACVAGLTMGSNLHLPPQEHAQMIKLIADNPALRALFSGTLPTLPLIDQGTGAAALGQSSNILATVMDDVQALPALAPNFFKGLAAKMRRAASRMDEQEARELVARDVADIMDCAKALPPGFWRQLDAKDPFNHALRIHSEWVETLARQNVDKDPESSKRWPTLVDRDRMGRVSALELVNGRELFEEGKAMSHCVASYSSHCHRGISRIVSLRIDGSRCSTLELAPFDARGHRLASLDFAEISQRKSVAAWSIVQHRGKCNAKVTHPDVLEFANQIAERSTKAFHARTSTLEDQRKIEQAEKIRLAAVGSLPSRRPLGA
jgi:hypothetical protein